LGSEIIQEERSWLTLDQERNIEKMVRRAGSLDNFDPGIAPRRALWEAVAERMRRAIILSELPAGLHLEEPALAQKFGVSRIPIREALIRLEQEGLVRVEPRRGAFIVGMTVDDIGDVYEFRLLVERHAARRAAERIDNDGINLLQDLVDEMDEALRRGEQSAMVVPDVSFHRQIVVESGSRQLLVAWERLAGLIEAILSVTDETYRDAPQALNGHQLIIDALANRDGEEAARHIEEHLANGEQVMREAMDASRVATARPGRG
jgi:DNA-binding GntR family transcriptional regulator